MNEVETFFAGLADRFRAGEAAGLNAVYQFDVSGPQGGVWHAELRDGTCTVASGPAASPDVTLGASDENLLKLVGGRLNPQMAVLTGKLRVAGDTGLALRLGSIFR